MGAYASILLKFPTMASNGAANFSDGGWISDSMDDALSFHENSTATDLRVGWALGQFYALDCMHARRYPATTYLTSYVEYTERFQLVTAADQHQSLPEVWTVTGKPDWIASAHIYPDYNSSTSYYQINGSHQH